MEGQKKPIILCLSNIVLLRVEVIYIHVNNIRRLTDGKRTKMARQGRPGLSLKMSTSLKRSGPTMMRGRRRAIEFRGF